MSAKQRFNNINIKINISRFFSFSLNIENQAKSEVISVKEGTASVKPTLNSEMNSLLEFSFLFWEFCTKYRRDYTAHNLVVLLYLAQSLYQDCWCISLSYRCNYFFFFFISFFFFLSFFFFYIFSTSCRSRQQWSLVLMLLLACVKRKSISRMLLLIFERKDCLDI